MSFITRIATGTALAAVAAGAAFGSVAANATTAFDYNLFVSGNMTAANSDTEGRVAVRGSVALNNYSVGLVSAGASPDLVVGGALAATNGTVYGSAVVGGAAATGGSFSAVNGIVSNAGTLPIDFAAETARVQGLSSYWSTLAQTGTLTNQYSQLTLSAVGGSATQVFNVTSLSGITTLRISASASQTVLVNIAGASTGLQFLGMSLSGGITEQHVMYNFYDATTLTLNGVGVLGSVMAPKADVPNGSGVVLGQLFVRNFNSNIQVNDYKFTGSLPTPPAVPEPATWAMMIAGFGLAGAALRRRAVRVAIA